MFKLEVIADPVKVQKVTTPPTPEVKKFLKFFKAEDVPESLHVYWSDVKKNFPQLEAALKPLFQGKEKLSVKELKEVIFSAPKDEAKFWLSSVPFEHLYTGHAQKKLGYPQIAVQLNIGPDLIKEIDKDGVVKKFFRYVSDQLSRQSLHPTHSQNIAWARIYTLPNLWIIEEIQSDIFGRGVDVQDISPNASGRKALANMTENEKKHVQEFFHKHFLNWEKKLLASVITLARSKGIHHIWMFDSDLKKSSTSSKSILQKIYEVTPRDLGFKKDTLEVDNHKFPAWHRVVAKSKLKANSELPFASLTKKGFKFETGTPIKFPFMRNTVSSKSFNIPEERYQQNIEPAGMYMIFDDMPKEEKPAKWEQGEMSFKNPLVLKWGEAYDHTSWKQALYDKFGASGKALTKKLLDEGYDGIVTVQDGDLSEIIKLKL